MVVICGYSHRPPLVIVTNQRTDQFSYDSGRPYVIPCSFGSLKSYGTPRRRRFKGFCVALCRSARETRDTRRPTSASGGSNRSKGSLESVEGKSVVKSQRRRLHSSLYSRREYQGCRTNSEVCRHRHRRYPIHVLLI